MQNYSRNFIGQSMPGRLLAGLTLSGLLLGAGVFHAAADPRADAGKGEELLKQAQGLMEQARHLQAVSLDLSKRGQEQMAAANAKTLEAKAMMREAFLLIRDPNRMQANELRERASEMEINAQAEGVELARLQQTSAHDQQADSDAAIAAAKLAQAVQDETNPALKNDLTNMKAALDKESAAAKEEMAGLDQRMAAIQKEQTHLNNIARALRAEAQRLDAHTQP